MRPFFAIVNYKTIGRHTFPGFLSNCYPNIFVNCHDLFVAPFACSSVSVDQILRDFHVSIKITAAFYVTFRIWYVFVFFLLRLCFFKSCRRYNSFTAYTFIIFKNLRSIKPFCTSCFLAKSVIFRLFLLDLLTLLFQNLPCLPPLPT